MGCLRVSSVHSLIISIRSFISFLCRLGQKKRRDSATWSEYPLTADPKRYEKRIGIDIQKRSLLLFAGVHT